MAKAPRRRTRGSDSGARVGGLCACEVLLDFRTRPDSIVHVFRHCSRTHPPGATHFRPWRFHRRRIRYPATTSPPLSPAVVTSSAPTRKTRGRTPTARTHTPTHLLNAQSFRVRCKQDRGPDRAYARAHADRNTSQPGDRRCYCGASCARGIGCPWRRIARLRRTDARTHT